jgi:hypothetical protein
MRERVAIGDIQDIGHAQSWNLFSSLLKSFYLLHRVDGVIGIAFEIRSFLRLINMQEGRTYHRK